ncbi:MAG: hypothetical protein PHH69_04310 [Candidatus Omnitrophica bacterium]|nr:hypothetical protein [Candidatus Omnitrophota bacterium]
MKTTYFGLPIKRNPPKQYPSIDYLDCEGGKNFFKSFRKYGKKIFHLALSLLLRANPPKNNQGIGRLFDHLALRIRYIKYIINK